jgi:hypothetical protein
MRSRPAPGTRPPSGAVQLARQARAARPLVPDRRRGGAPRRDDVRTRYSQDDLTVLARMADPAKELAEVEAALAAGQP